MNVFKALRDLAPDTEEFLAAALRGLSRREKSLPCKFFYDRKGSALFDAICGTPEYYLTRTEEAILHIHAAEITALFGKSARIVEFGCGSLNKVQILLDQLEDVAAFVPIDISRDHLVASAEILAGQNPGLEILPICADYTQPLEIPGRGPGKKGRSIGFFLGSTIGNFDHGAARAFLDTVAGIVGPDGALLVGVDTKKDETILNAAYNDAAGLNAAFNLNMLVRANRELGADFNLSAFRHRASYNARAGRVELYLISLRDQIVTIAGEKFSFRAGETLHTENSYKYTEAEFLDLSREAGFRPVKTWTGGKGLFAVYFLEVA